MKTRKRARARTAAQDAYVAGSHTHASMPPARPAALCTARPTRTPSRLETPNASAPIPDGGGGPRTRTRFWVTCARAARTSPAETRDRDRHPDPTDRARERDPHRAQRRPAHPARARSQSLAPPAQPGLDAWRAGGASPAVASPAGGSADRPPAACGVRPRAPARPARSDGVAASARERSSKARARDSSVCTPSHARPRARARFARHASRCRAHAPSSADRA